MSKRRAPFARPRSARPNDAGSNRGSLRPQARLSDRRHGLWHGPKLAWLVKQKQITPHIPVFDKSTRTDGTFSRSDFTLDLKPIATLVRPASTLSSSGAPTRSRAPASPPKEHAVISPARRIAAFANSRRGAARIRRREKFRETWMRTPVMWRAPLLRRRNMRSLAAVGKRSRCCSPTSSASWGWDDCGCAVQAAPRMSSCSRRQRKTYGDSPDCGQRCRQWRRWRHRPPIGGHVAAKRQFADALFAGLGAVRPIVRGLFQRNSPFYALRGRRRASGLIRQRGFSPASPQAGPRPPRSPRPPPATAPTSG